MESSLSWIIFLFSVSQLTYMLLSVSHFCFRCVAGSCSVWMLGSTNVLQHLQDKYIFSV